MSEPPRHDPSGRTPLLEKEGKVLIYNTITFSSFLRRSTLTESKISDETPFVGAGLTVASGVSGGGGLLFRQPSKKENRVVTENNRGLTP